MHDDGDRQIRQFQSTCSALVDEYYNRLDEGAIVSAPFSNNTILSENVDNIFGYEKVIAMSLSYDRDVRSVEVAKIKYGIPTKNVIRGNDIEVNMMGENDNQMISIKIDNPTKILTEDGKESELIRKNEMSKTYFNIPYNDAYAQAIAKDLESIRSRPRTVTDPNAPQPGVSKYDLKSQFMKAKEDFKE